MPIIRLLPAGTDYTLEQGASLTDLEFDYFGERTIPFGCRAGACGACLVQVVEGAEALGAADANESDFMASLGVDPQQHRLACQCCLGGDVTLRVVGGEEATPELATPEAALCPAESG